MKIIKENIDKISLNELEDDTRIWDVMLPEIRKHLNGESSIFDGIQCNGKFEGYTEAGITLVESAVISPRLAEYRKNSDNGGYTFEWTKQDDLEFSDYIKARWSYMMWLVYEAMNGTLNERLTFKSTLGTTWEKILDEAWERDYKVVCLLCGDLDKTGHVRGETTLDEDDIKSDLPF